MGSKMTPPLVVTLPEYVNSDDHTKTTYGCLQRLFREDDISLRYTKNMTYFHTHSKEAYELLIKYMQFRDQEYYTFMPPWNKAKQIILKGIFAVDRARNSESDIVNDLAKKGVNCLKIDAIGERWHEKESPIYLLELAEETNLDEVKNIDIIVCENSPWGIKWQDYVEKRNRPVQCYRCQRYHHRSNYCYMIPRCVACAEKHFSKDCEMSKNDTPRCCNCDGEHRADDRECPEWIQYKERLAASGEKKLRST